MLGKEGRMLRSLKKYLPSPLYKILKWAYLFFLFLKDYWLFRKKNRGQTRFPLAWENSLPQLYDKTAVTAFDKHYLYHTAWAARVVAKIKPDFHTDIASSLYFCTQVSAFVPVRFYDYRPARFDLSGLTSEHADLTSLHFQNNSVKSLSCMHTVEHVGLGRYGDPLDPDGDLKAVRELKRVLAPGGSLLFVVPVGKPKLAFNAHRIYSYEQVIEYFSDLKLQEFTLISEKDEKSGLIVNADKTLVEKEDYGCGCFWFVK